MKNQVFKISLLCGVGGLLEFYDFILYIIFSDQISKNFFEEISNPFLKSLIVIAVFSVAYIVRPIGGIIVGWLGDVRGRKTSFTMTIFVMGASSLLMGIMPTYAQIGLIASIIFVLLRIIQGFALGGELPSAVVFVFESLEKKGLALGIMFGLVLCGFLFGNAVSILLRNLFGEYAWRAAFISGSAVALLTYYVRSRLSETTLFKHLTHKTKFPPGLVIKEYLQNTIGATLCVIMVAFYGVVVSLYIPKYLTLHLDYPQHTVSIIMIISSLVNVFGVIFMSWLSDKTNYHTTYKILSIILIIVTYPVFYLMNTKINLNLIIGIFLISLPVSFASGLFMRLICEAFPTNVRLTGVGIAYNLAFALVGGVAPVSIELLIKNVGLINGPVIIAIVCGLCGLISTPLLAKKQFLN